MKILCKSVFLTLLFTLIGSAAVSAAVAQVVAEDPDGAEILRNGAPTSLVTGDLLQEGDIVISNAATVVISICDGALVTLYPDSEILVASLSSELATVNLMKGELLGDTISGCAISVGNKVGTADISNGVYGVLLNETGEGWTLQIRNLDGNVTFTGGDKLDTSNLTVSLLEAGKTVPIPAGEEIIVRGIYDPSSEVFSLLSGGAAIAMLPDETIGQMRESSIIMSSIGRRGDDDQGQDDDQGDDQGDDDQGEDEDIIDLPDDDVETASDKG